MSDQTPDLSSIFAQAAQMQEQMAAVREQAAQEELVGQAAGGKVTVTVNGEMEFRSVHIDPVLMDDAEMLEDLILAALRDAGTQVTTFNQQAMGGLFGS